MLYRSYTCQVSWHFVLHRSHTSGLDPLYLCFQLLSNYSLHLWKSPSFRFLCQIYLGLFMHDETDCIMITVLHWLRFGLLLRGAEATWSLRQLQVPTWSTNHVTFSKGEPLMSPHFWITLLLLYSTSAPCLFFLFPNLELCTWIWNHLILSTHLKYNSYLHFIHGWLFVCLLPGKPQSHPWFLMRSVLSSPSPISLQGLTWFQIWLDQATYRAELAH